jgi:hypothetical protein
VAVVVAVAVDEEDAAVGGVLAPEGLDGVRSSGDDGELLPAKPKLVGAGV